MLAAAAPRPHRHDCEKTGESAMTRERYGRRWFMGLTGSGLAGVFGGAGLGTTAALAAAPDSQDADLVVFNAKVFTVDTSQPRAEAFAVKAGKFTAVGSTADIKGLI